MDSRDFAQQMQRLSDEELTEIVSFGEKDGYLPEAVEAARKELVARNRSSTDVSTIAYSVETRRNRDEELASQPLSWPARVAFLILPVVGLSLPIMVFVALSLGTRGYRQKSSEAWKWMGLGITFWIGLIIFFVVIELGYI
jgi:lipopolysaccharide export LptBFGC system permease protein LptF